jgi:hypothetical protein
MHMTIRRMVDELKDEPPRPVAIPKVLAPSGDGWLTWPWGHSAGANQSYSTESRFEKNCLAEPFSIRGTR